MGAFVSSINSRGDQLIIIIIITLFTLVKKKRSADQIKPLVSTGDQQSSEFSICMHGLTLHLPQVNLQATEVGIFQ